MFESLDRYQPIVEDWDGFQRSLRTTLPTCAWANPLRTNRDRVVQSLEAAGIACRPLKWHPDAFVLPERFRPGHRIEFICGHYQVQEEAALIPVMLMQLQRGQRVLDMCAAPGNKTAQICVALQNTGTVVANDRSYQRLRAARNTADRLGLLNMVVTCSDGSAYPRGAGTFDAVLADVPCSCEGTTRKNPGALKTTAIETSKRLGNTQRALLAKAFALCKPGGVVVYSTCSYAPEENESVVRVCVLTGPHALARARVSCGDEERDAGVAAPK